MRKELKRIRLTVDQWSRESYGIPVIPIWVYSRHLHRRAASRTIDGTVIIDLANGWYVHSFSNGKRVLSALPF